MSVNLGELATLFNCELSGDSNAKISHVATLSSATSGSISFFANKNYKDQLQSTSASAVILQSQDEKDCSVAKLISTNPYLTYAQIANFLHPVKQYKPGIHKSAVISPSSIISKTAHISALVVIGEKSKIGPGAYIGPGCNIGDSCCIGKDSKLMKRVTLDKNVNLGERCIVHPGAVLGGDGFGNARTEKGWFKVPQLGGVDIGDDVEIGCNTTIDCGSIGNTIIENGVRIDNLIQIGHNVFIGEHTAIAASTAIAGSAIIGKRCLLAGQVGIVGHIKICDDVNIGGAAVVTKDIKESGSYSGSIPAEKDSKWKRTIAKFRNL